MRHLLKTSIQVFCFSLVLAIGACATTGEVSHADVYDPLEPMNRVVFAFNEGLDFILLDPVTEIYRFIVPDPVRIAIGNILNNLKSPVYLANELLQGDISGATIVAQRFILNTFTGFGGILDTASWEGMTHESGDFGQTLANWGVNSGFYLVLPVLGPSNVRDTVGMVGDMAMDPLNWYMWNNDKDGLAAGRLVATYLTAKDRVYNMQNDLKINSLDYYATVRSIMTQRRNTSVYEDDIYFEYD